MRTKSQRTWYLHKPSLYNILRLHQSQNTEQTENTENTGRQDKIVSKRISIRY